MRFCSNQQGEKIALACGDPGDPRLEFRVTLLCQKQQTRLKVGQLTLSGGRRKEFGLSKPLQGPVTMHGALCILPSLR